MGAQVSTAIIRANHPDRKHVLAAGRARSRGDLSRRGSATPVHQGPASRPVGRGFHGEQASHGLPVSGQTDILSSFGPAYQIGQSPFRIGCGYLPWNFPILGDCHEESGPVSGPRMACQALDVLP